MKFNIKKRKTENLNKREDETEIMTEPSETIEVESTEIEEKIQEKANEEMEEKSSVAENRTQLNNDLSAFQPTEDQFGVFWKYMQVPTITDIDYNGRDLWITDLEKGKHRVEEEITPLFLEQFAHNIGNAGNKHFNKAHQVLEVDVNDLRISILHDSVAMTGTSVCIRKSPAIVRNSIESLLENNFCPKKILHLLINCVQIGLNFVTGGEPGHGKTEFTKFLMQFIPNNQRVITIEDSLEIHYSSINPDGDCLEIKVDDKFTYTDAIKASLRQNPKWLVLSEARSTEVTSLIEQWSTGVKGFSTIHLDDLRKLPERIQNMMNDVNDADRMENRIYQFVNVGILVRMFEDSSGNLRRYIDQMCFYCREDNENKIYMLVKNGELFSEELPRGIKKKFRLNGIANPFVCENIEQYISEGK